MSVGAAFFYISLCVVSLALFGITSEKIPPDRDDLVLRSTWRMCIVALALVALLIGANAHDRIGIFTGYGAVAIVYAMNYCLNQEHYPIVWRQIFVPLVLIACVYYSGTYVMPWIVNVKPGFVHVSGEELVISGFVIVSLFLTYTPPGKWLWKEAGPVNW